MFKRTSSDEAYGFIVKPRDKDSQGQHRGFVASKLSGIKVEKHYSERGDVVEQWIGFASNNMHRSFDSTNPVRDLRDLKNRNYHETAIARDIKNVKKRRG